MAKCELELKSSVINEHNRSVMEGQKESVVRWTFQFKIIRHITDVQQTLLKNSNHRNIKT